MEDKESTARVKKTIGAFRFRVEGYSSVSTKVGESIESDEFDLCGHTWQLRIFPGGSQDAHTNFVSFYLASKSTEMVRASYKLIVLAQLPNKIDEVFTSSGIRTFEAKGIQVSLYSSVHILMLHLSDRSMVGAEINSSVRRSSWIQSLAILSKIPLYLK